MPTHYPPLCCPNHDAPLLPVELKSLCLLWWNKYGDLQVEHIVWVACLMWLQKVVVALEESAMAWMHERDCGEAIISSCAVINGCKIHKIYQCIFIISI